MKGVPKNFRAVLMCCLHRATGSRPARIVVLLGVFLSAWTSVPGQTPLQKVVLDNSTNRITTDHSEPGASGGTTTPEDIEKRLAELRAQLAAIVELRATNLPVGISPQDLWRKRAALHRLVLLNEQRLTDPAALDTARLRKAETEREVRAWTRFDEPPPYSILVTDRLRKQIQAERQKIASLADADSTLTLMVEDNQRMLNESQETIRQLNERLESANDASMASRLAWQRDFENLRSQVAATTIAMLNEQQAVGRERKEESQLRLGLLRRQLIIADAGMRFIRADLDRATGLIELNSEQLERELNECQARLPAVTKAFEEARSALQLSPGQPEQVSPNSRATLLAKVRQSQLETLNTTITVLRMLLESASVERTMWEFRFATYENPRLEGLKESERNLGGFTRRLQLWRDNTRQQVNSVSSQLQIQEARLGELAADPSLLSLERENFDALQERERILERLAGRLEELRQLTERWAEGLRDAKGKLPLADRVRNLFSDAGLSLSRLWSFEVFTAEDTITVDGQKISGKRSITIGKIVLALLIVVVGYWVTGIVTVFLERIIVKRVRIEPNQANLIRRWLRAFLIACLLLFSLVSVKIPFTVFAFAGGALAIGLGFGTQNVLKNFISGLILLFERPFRVGDVLDIGGQRGTITVIGLRASVLQLWDGTETLIPNSFLLENNVTNWTYSNRRVRFFVTVGVAYGTDARRVTEALAEVAERHGLVEKEPKPQVLFTDFGESTLNFELRYWVDFSRANPPQVASDLRLMIASAFAEKGIVIAFPQRDVHLDTARPLQFQVVRSCGAPPSAAAAIPQKPDSP